jgi:hypothetical protein
VLHDLYTQIGVTKEIHSQPAYALFSDYQAFSQERSS